MEGTIKTTHGTIIKDNNKYLTHRKPEHYFIKHKGYGISKTEIKQMIKHEVKTIIIYYHKKDGTTRILKTNLNTILLEGTKWNNNGDEQIIINEKHLKLAGIEKA